MTKKKTTPTAPTTPPPAPVKTTKPRKTPAKTHKTKPSPDTKKAAATSQQADDARLDGKGYEDSLGPRPGGGRWRPVELEAARLRAEGYGWREVHEKITSRGIKYSQAALTNFTYKVWWNTAYAYFSGLRAAAIEAERAEAMASEREAWREQDDKLKRNGTQLAIAKLIETLQGMRPRDEMLFRKLRKGGLSVEDADAQAREKGKMPAPADIVWAAREMLKATGYTKLNEALADAAVSSEVKAREVAGVPTQAGGEAGAGGPRVLKVSVEMAGVDYDPDDGPGVG